MPHGMCVRAYPAEKFSNPLAVHLTSLLVLNLLTDICVLGLYAVDLVFCMTGH